MGQGTVSYTVVLICHAATEYLFVIIAMINITGHKYVRQSLFQTFDFRPMQNMRLFSFHEIAAELFHTSKDMERCIVIEDAIEMGDLKSARIQEFLNNESAYDEFDEDISGGKGENVT